MKAALWQLQLWSLLSKHVVKTEHTGQISLTSESGFLCLAGNYKIIALANTDANTGHNVLVFRSVKERINISLDLSSFP